MSARLRAVARENEAIVAAGRYRSPGGREVTIADQVSRAVAGTRIHGPEPVTVPDVTPPPRKRGGFSLGSIEPHDGQALTAARKQISSVLRRSAAPQAKDGIPHSAEAERPLPRTGMDRRAERGTAIDVTGESSLEAARRLAAEAADPVAVLNFASARNPGGGYLNGAKAQEEDLCRTSALYACLRAAPDFYEHHRTHRSAFYTDRVIHAPGVPVFRDERSRLLEVPYAVGFLTSPAPNAGVIARTAPHRAGRIRAALDARSERVLEVAAAHGYRRLVLGAWGCGVFRNEPADVAGAFAAHLTVGGRFGGRFERVVFAVLDRRPGSPTRTAFAEVFRDVAGSGRPQR